MRSHQRIIPSPSSSSDAEANQGIPHNLRVLLAPAAPTGLQANLPMVWEDLLYERFRCMKVLEYEGLTDPIEADNWLIDIQGFVTEFKMMYYNTEILAAQQDGFNSMRQRSMTILLEASELQARIFAYTKGDVEAGTSHYGGGIQLLRSVTEFMIKAGISNKGMKDVG
ncbi:hypothetical protein TIFTF001_014329 [Ficus carica]|uniref:Uncharacterized protein n=1 Tax=Ficus carica TaxID=3494 RepID=A0AA88D6W0_FICCA|nr:hypothetical protein TIFTF001_014329 [Ficus carica]